MTKIITCSELRYHTLAELEALFRTLQIELGRPHPFPPNAPSCSPASTASAAPWRCASTGSRSSKRRRIRPCRTALPAALRPDRDMSDVGQAGE